MPVTGTPSAGNDLITITPSDSFSVDALGGIDTLKLNFSSSTADIRHLYYSGGYYRYTDDFLTTVDYLNFERFDLTMGSGDDMLVGGALNDRLVGGGGNDWISGGLGADTMIGGAGSDRWEADYSTLATDVGLTLLAVGTATIAATGANLNGIEAITLTTGAGADTINTEAFGGDDQVYSGTGDDQVALGRGIDLAHGGEDVGDADIDTLHMDWSAVTDPTLNISHAYYSGGYYRYSNGEDQLDYQGFEQYHLQGGIGHDALYGAGLNDTLVGNGGNDLLAGGQGDDVIDGGAGTDLWVADTSDRFALTVVDLVAQTTNYGTTLSGVERLDYTGGNAIDRVTASAGIFDDVINTGAGNDVVSTGRGIDITHGGDGTADRLVMDWSGITDDDDGITHGYYSGGYYRYHASSEDQLDYQGFEIFDMTGGAGDDYLVGGALNDTLRGNGGDDTLSSGIGDAVIDGGAGEDLWVGDISAQGKVVFNAGLGQTTAQLTTLGLSVLRIEQLSLSTGNGADSINTEGYALNDWISTTGGNDTVAAGLGRDTMDGGAGIDVLSLDYASATSSVYNAYYSGGYYRYQMADGTSWAEWINFDRFDITGGAFNDRLDGGGNADTLNGGAGNDVLNGGAGKDVITGGAGTDTYIGNYASLATAMTLTLTATGAGTITGPGTRLTGIENVQLTTGAGADVINLSAARGNDVVNTGNGDDVINLGRGMRESADGGLGTDTFILNASLATSGLRMAYYSGGYYRIASTDGKYIADFAGMERLNLTGGNGSDFLFGFDLGDTLAGGNGTDHLNGGKGNDILTGGAGADAFEFSDLINAGRDLITDADSGDILVLQGLALTGSVTAGGGGAVTAGQVQVSSAGGVSTLHIGLDATAGADLRIDLTGTFTAADFAASGSVIQLL
ncbi:MAG: hypothetical protein KBF78_03805 [Fuscovulum sp.]|nr:hypothetical protein [Fuscovulum sp.]